MTAQIVILSMTSALALAGVIIAGAMVLRGGNGGMRRTEVPRTEVDRAHVEIQEQIDKGRRGY